MAAVVSLMNLLLFVTEKELRYSSCFGKIVHTKLEF